MKLGKRRNLIKILFVAGLPFIFVACSMSASIQKIVSSNNSSLTISGTVLTSDPNLGLATQSTCANRTASLYKINADGSLATTSLATTAVNADGTYAFAGAINLDATGNRVQYLVGVSSCGTYFSRPITDLSHQDVSVATTFVEQISRTQDGGMKPLSQIAMADMLNVLTALGGFWQNSLALTYDAVNADATTKTLLKNVFNLSSFSNIRDLSYPDVQTLTVPNTLNEGSANSFVVTATHWYYGTAVAYDWILDGSSVSHATPFAYTPSLNSQGTHSMALHIGIDNGGGLIDPSKSFLTKTFPLAITNTFPAVVPALTLTSASPTNSLITTLSLATGAALVNCATFSKLALTEDTVMAPADPSLYTLSCSSAGTQTLNFTLGLGDGVHTINLWAIDSAGNTSTVAQNVNVTLDQTPPVVAFGSLASAYAGGASANIPFSVTDATSGVQSLILYYAPDGSSFSQLADLSAQTSPYVWTVPGSDIVPAAAALKLIATDNAGNTSSVTSSLFAIMTSPPPAPVLTLTSANPTNSLAATVNAVCSGTASQIYLSDGGSAPASTVAGWVNCTGSDLPVTLSVGDGTHTISAWTKDVVGNVNTTAGTVTVVLDQTPPSLVLNSMNSGGFRGGTAQSINWTASDANFGATPITVEYTTNGTTWNLLATVANTPSTYSWMVPLAETNLLKVRLTAVDTAGNSTQVVSANNLMIDNTPPTLATGQLTINNGATTTTSNFVQVSFQLNDNYAASEFCLKYNDNSAPSAGDPCWDSVTNASAGSQTPGPSITVSNYTFQIGFGAGANSVYVWAMDLAGNMSTLSNSGAGTLGQDYATITYNPGSAPVVSTLVATKQDLPSANPPALSDLTIPQGSSVYIRWTATNSSPLPANAISLFYKLDGGSSWLPIPGAQGLANSGNGGCTVDDPSTTTVETGCFVWAGGSPSNGAYQIEVRATNSNTLTSLTATGLINGIKIRTLAGNTDPGVDGSARAAIYYNFNYGEQTFVNQFVVAPNGNVYIYDYRGLFLIQQQTGVNQLLAPITGTLSGLNGPVQSATFDGIGAINLDNSGNLLIRTTNLILKMSTATTNPNLVPFIGGGSQNTPGVSPLSYQINRGVDFAGYAFLTLVPLPNGDLYFDDDSNQLMYYQASTNKIQQVPFSGTGDSYDSGDSFSSCYISNFGFAFDRITSNLSYLSATLYGPCSQGQYTPAVRFDPQTFVSIASYPGGYFDTIYSHLDVLKTGLDGNVYGVERLSGYILKYDPVGNAFNPLIGTGTPGFCADGTQALSCAITPSDVFVTRNGVVYFYDGGRLRTILQDGTVFTIYGAWGADGDGGSALTARLYDTNFVQMSNDGVIQFYQNSDNVIRQILTDGSVSRIAGNGTAAAVTPGVPATSSSVAGNLRFGETNNFITDPVTADIYYSDWTGTFRLTRASGQWSQVVGGGGSYIENSDGDNGSQIDGTTSTVRVLGLVGSKLYVAYRRFDNSPNGDFGITKYYDTASNYKQHPFTGLNSGSGSPSCSDGMAMSSCFYLEDPAWPGAAFFFDSTGSRLFMPQPQQGGGSYSNSLDYRDASGKLRTISLGHPLRNSAAYGYNSSTSSDMIYYCSSDGNLYAADITHSTETQLSWPVASITCSGTNMVYDSSNNRLLLIYSQNGLNGVAEYILP